MEFPHNALTNVHKIDGVHSIGWETFSADIPPGTPSRRGPSSPIPSPQADFLGTATDASYRVQSDLRRSGRHVFYDRDQSKLWVLRLIGSSPTDSAATDEDRTTAEIIRRHGLKKTESGSFQAVDLTLGQPAAMEAKSVVATAHTPTIQPAHKQITQLKASYDRSGVSDVVAANSQAGRVETLDRPAQKTQDVYSKFVSATLLSISYSLVGRGEYIPLGSNLMVRAPTTSATNDLTLDNEPTGLEAIELGVHWATSGSLTITVSPSSPLGFHQVSATITGVDHTSNAFYGREIRLAPSSFSAKIRTIEPRGGSAAPGSDEAVPNTDGVYMGEQRQLNRQRWKSRVRVCLATRGIPTTDQEQWVEAELTGPQTLLDAVDTAMQPSPVNAGTILWPAALCFFPDQVGEPPTTDHAAWLFRPMEDFFHDPLLDAETWYKAKAEREAALELKRQEKELLARSKETVNFDDGDEETPDVFARTNQYLDAQAINGVYPTPPDGYQPQVASALTTNDSQTLLAGHGATVLAMDMPQDVQAATTPAATTTGFGLGSGNYENNDEEDLFGDMDTETFATNGLTEADFSFFDEPDADTKERDDDKHFYDESIVTNMHSSSTTFENMATGGLAPSLTISYKDEANKSIADKGGCSSDDQLREPTNGQAEVANVLSPPTSPKIMRKLAHPAVQESAALDRDLEAQMGVVQAVPLVETAHDQHQRSLFDPVVLSYSTQTSDDKYSEHGRYDFKASAPPLDRDVERGTNLVEHSIPRLGFHPHRKSRLSIQQSQLLTTSDNTFPRSTGGLEGATESNGTDSETTEDKDSYLNLHADLSIKSLETAETSNHGAICSKKRKRGLEYVDDLISTPSPRTGYSSDASEHMLSYPEPSILVLNSIQDLAIPTAELSMAAVRRLKAPSTKIETLSGNDYIQLAQILADQLASRDMTPPPRLAPSNIHNLVSTSYPTSAEEPFAEILLTLFRNSKQCDLKTYTEIGVQTLEEPAIAKPVVRSDQRRPTLPTHGSLRANAQHGIIKMQMPYVRVQRTAKPLEVLPSAYPFWETLGLGPCHGPKDISAYCIYLSSDGVQRSVDTFIDMLGSVYDGCKLGIHKRGMNVNGLGGGLVPVKAKFEGEDGKTQPVPEDFIQAVESVCEDLGKSLSRNPTQGQNIVVYMVDTFGDSKVLPELCAAFLGMFQAYVSAPQVQQLENPSDLVLQILPEGFIASKETIVMPLPAEYRRLAFEVYDRCVPSALERRDEMLNSAPAVQLAETLPRTIEFCLTAEPAWSLLHTDRCLHVGYSYKSSNGWLSAAWTDSLGMQQWSASYGLCRGTSDVQRSLSEITREIWETTVDIVRARKGVRRILIVKDGAMATEEIQTWILLAAQTADLSPLLALSSIDTNPSLSFPSRVSTSLTAIAGSDTQLGMYASPVSTPLANATSPELLSHAPTPGAGPTMSGDQHSDTDINARLINSTDETWGVVLAQPLNSTVSLFEYRPALASGYLIKRAGPKDEDGLVSMGVNLLHAQKSYQVQLRDILNMFHGLGTLARIRGLVDPVRGILPCHMATVVNARSGLDRML